MGGRVRLFEPRYELFYWPGIPGRGEFVRLALEDAGAPYDDVGRMPESEGGGVPAILAALEGGLGGVRPFAPPFLRAGRLVIAQTANILHWLGPRLGLAPDDEAGRVTALQHQLTIADLVTEAHDTHHPIGVSLYYEDQKPAAKRRAALFVKERMPKFLGYFEALLDGRPWLCGRTITYADLSLFQVLEGLAYAFPKSFARRKIPRLRKLRDAVAGRARIRAYLASERRVPFNEEGIFRRYPELDRP
jgi:glutathione S-transferase